MNNNESQWSWYKMLLNDSICSDAALNAAVRSHRHNHTLITLGQFSRHKVELLLEAVKCRDK